MWVAFYSTGPQRVLNRQCGSENYTLIVDKWRLTRFARRYYIPEWIIKNKSIFCCTRIPFSENLMFFLYIFLYKPTFHHRGSAWIRNMIFYIWGGQWKACIWCKNKVLCKWSSIQECELVKTILKHFIIYIAPLIKLGFNERILYFSPGHINLEVNWNLIIVIGMSMLRGRKKNAATCLETLILKEACLYTFVQKFWKQ